MLLCVIYFIKIVKLITDTWWVPLATVYVVTKLFLKFYEFGNLTEEYAMVFISIALYVFLSYLRGKKFAGIELLMGAACGCVLMLRPNMIGVWCVFCSVIFVILILKKDKQDLIRFVLNFIIGNLIVLMVFLIWLWYKGALSDFLNCYIVFNVKYSNAASWGDRIMVIKKFLFVPQVGIPVVSSVILMVASRHKNIEMIMCLCCVFVSLILLAMSGRGYGHYGMVLVPLMVYLVAFCFNKIGEWCQTRQWVCCKGSCNFICVNAIMFIFLCVGVIDMARFCIKTIKKSEINGEILKTTELVTRNSIDKDRILVYGNLDNIYVYSKRLHATNYSYQFPLIDIDEKIRDDFWNQMCLELPKLVIVQNMRMDSDMDAYLRRYRYRLVSSKKDLHRVYAR